MVNDLDNIIDIGCGQGYFLNNLEINKKKAFGIDLSVDQQASDLVKKIEAEVREGKALDQIAEAHKDVVQYMSNVTVPKDNSDGGLSAAAARLKPEVISNATKTLQGDGYYFILLRKSDDQTITYDYIRVPLTMFSQQFEALKKDNKVQYYIKM
jgi:SAM-dependent methyltransferase